MTSELLILTSSAVTLVADSAVTVGGRKTYNGVNKLFMLSNNPPMGIMNYNLATFLDIPLETIIKEFRKINCSFECYSIKDFKDEFEKFLKKIAETNGKSFNDQVKSFINSCREDYNLSSEKFKEIIYKNATPFSPENLGLYYDDIMSNLEDNIIFFKDFLIEIDEYSKAFLDILQNSFINLVFLNSYNGIVISGFEKERMFPSYIEFKINYLYDTNFMIYDEEMKNLKRGEVLVKPFAQVDVINTFLYSINSETQKVIINYFDIIQSKYIDTLVESIKENDKLEGEVESLLLNEISKIKIESSNLSKLESLMDLLKMYHFRPISNSIASLPKEELSNLAESLIKITSLKRKVQNTLETVGGPVDVAIITKGDGFIWTKRKHYFDGKLNPQFFNNNVYK